MKIYLAGASSERDLIRVYRDKLIAAGHEITYDWIADVDANVAKGKTDRDLDLFEAKNHAWNDFDGVRRSQILWLLIPANPKSSIGCWFELGAALAEGGIQIVASGDARASIFLSLCDLNYATHDEAFDRVCAGFAPWVYR